MPPRQDPRPSARPERPEADAAPTPPASSSPESAQSAPPARAAADDDESDPLDLALPVTATFTLSGLLAALLADRLHRQRARQRQHRRLHHRLAASSQPQTETTVCAAARPADVERLDHVLRALPVLLRDVPADLLPDVIAVWIGPDALHLILTTQAPGAPAPFTIDATGKQWILDAYAALPPLRGGEVALLPTLVTVASHPEGHHLLVDLERVGALTITGDPQQTANMLRYLATKLATSTWSDDTDIAITGLDPTEAAHLTTLGGHRIRTVDPARAAKLAHRGDTTTSRILRAARIAKTGGDPPTPLVILAAGTDASTAVGLGSSASQETHAIAAAARTKTAFSLRIGADGSIHLDWLDTTGLAVVQPRAQYAVTVIGASSGLASRAPLEALGWLPRTPLSVTIAHSAIVVEIDADSSITVSDKRYLHLPAAIRHQCHLRAGDRLLAAAHVDSGLLLLYPETVIDSALFDHHRSRTFRTEQ